MSNIKQALQEELYKNYLKNGDGGNNKTMMILERMQFFLDAIPVQKVANEAAIKLMIHAISRSVRETQNFSELLAISLLTYINSCEDVE